MEEGATQTIKFVELYLEAVGDILDERR